MTEAGPPALGVGEFIRPGKDARNEFRGQHQAVTLMAAEWQQRAAVKVVIGVCAGTAILVDDPARGR